MQLQKEMMEQQQKVFEEQLKVQREAMMAQTQSLREAMTPAKTTGGTLGAQNLGVRSARSARQSTANLGRGISSLRIPLNVGGDIGSGLNIG